MLQRFRPKGYIVELIEGHGLVRVLAKAEGWHSQLVIDSRARALGSSGLRYERDMGVPEQWINIVRMPPRYGYSGYHATVPVPRRYGRVAPAHVGPNIQLLFRPPTFCVYYVNPNLRRRRLRLSLDVFPVVATPRGIPLYDIWGSVDPASREEWWRETLVYQILARAEEDYEDPEIEKVLLELEAPADIAPAYRLFTAKFPQLRRVLGRVGVEVYPAEAGRHPYKAVNPKNGRTADIPRHGGREMAPGLVAKICRDLGLERDDVLRAAGRRR